MKTTSLVSVRAGLTLSVSLKAKTNAAVDPTKTSASAARTVFVAP